MKIRALDSSGDWTFGQGKGSYLVGTKEIIQDIKTALEIFLGECFWNVKFGVDWFNLIGGQAPIAQQNIILQCRQTIISRAGVVKINSVSAKFEDYRRSLTIIFDVTTIYGSVQSSLTKGFNNVN